MCCVAGKGRVVVVRNCSNIIASVAICITIVCVGVLNITTFVVTNGALEPVMRSVFRINRAIVVGNHSSVATKIAFYVAGIVIVMWCNSNMPAVVTNVVANIVVCVC